MTDANAPSSGSAAAAVDDDGLPGGNPASTIDRLDANWRPMATSSEATFTGVLGGSVGSDGAGANGFSFAGLNGTGGTVGTETVTYSWDGGTNTLTATGPRGALFKVQITDQATGAYTVTLLDNVLHATGPNNENSPDPTTSLTYSITDADGSTAPGTLTITFDDDAPTATAEAAAERRGRGDGDRDAGISSQARMARRSRTSTARRWCSALATAITRSRSISAPARSR